MPTSAGHPSQLTPGNPARAKGVEPTSGEPTTDRGRARGTGAQRRRRRVRRARLEPGGDRLPYRIPDRPQRRRRRGRRPGRPRQGLARAAALPSRRAVAAVAARDRRERGAQPPPRGRQARGARPARRRTSFPRGARLRLPREALLAAERARGAARRARAAARGGPRRALVPLPARARRGGDRAGPRRSAAAPSSRAPRARSSGCAPSSEVRRGPQLELRLAALGAEIAVRRISTPAFRLTRFAPRGPRAAAPRGARSPSPLRRSS